MPFMAGQGRGQRWREGGTEEDKGRVGLAPTWLAPPDSIMALGRLFPGNGAQATLSCPVEMWGARARGGSLGRWAHISYTNIRRFYFLFFTLEANKLTGALSSHVPRKRHLWTCVHAHIQRHFLHTQVQEHIHIQGLAQMHSSMHISRQLAQASGGVPRGAV